MQEFRAPEVDRQPTRMQAVQSPIIPEIAALIRRYPGTISLGQGVVSYGPPPQAIAQVREFFNHPEQHKYQAVQGITPLLRAIAAKLKTENGIEIDPQTQIVVTAGSNMGFMHAILAITLPGDEIILQTPYYFNHEMAIATASCRPVLVPTDAEYQLCPKAIAAAITERTRAIVTVSPNNPSGAVYSRRDLEAVNQLCRDRGLYHISDEAYEYFTYEGVEHLSPARFDPGSQHTLSLFSLSKAYGFASWRIGYMVIPTHLLEAVKRIQDTVLICPPVISQYAALGALQAGRAYCEPHLQAIAATRQQVLEQLQPLQSFCRVAPAAGAFYLFLQIDIDLDAITVVERLIREYGVAVIPGTTFGLEQGCYLRVAYGALTPETLAPGMARLVQGLEAISSGPSPP